MKQLVAVLDKKDNNAAETAAAMLATMTETATATCTIATPTAMLTGSSLKTLHKPKSPTAILYASTTAHPHEEPPIVAKADDIALVIVGTTYSVSSEAASDSLLHNVEDTADDFIKTHEGCFIIAAAEKERLLAGRDALGAHPLYYGENQCYAVLATERRLLWEIGVEDAKSFPPGHSATATASGFKFKPAKTLTYSKPKQTTMLSARQKTQTLLEQAVTRRVAEAKDVAVAFSGGLDSTTIAFLARKAGSNVQLVHVSMKNRQETDHACKVADELGLPIHSYVYGENDVHEALPTVLRLIEKPDPVKAAIGIPIYWAAARTAELKLNVMLAGQGADELFAGYKRYVDIYLDQGEGEAYKAVFDDIRSLHEDNLEGDFKICNFHDVELRLPFADYDLARFAATLPVKLKMEPAKDTLRKVVLRTAAGNLGVPESATENPKKAVQYATGVSNALARIAKQHGLTTAAYVCKVFRATMKKGDCK